MSQLNRAQKKQSNRHYLKCERKVDGSYTGKADFKLESDRARRREDVHEVNDRVSHLDFSHRGLLGGPQ